jgi:hypothetical protein
MHLTLGILRQSQAVSHALAFFQLDGFADPALVVEFVETQRRYPQGQAAIRWAFQKYSKVFSIGSSYLKAITRLCANNLALMLIGVCSRQSNLSSFPNLVISPSSE